jgi:acyl carrier protein
VLLALRNASAPDRIAMASGILGEIIAKVLRLPASKLDMDQNINQLGIDSLMAVELQTLIAERTGAHFSPMDFMAGMSIMTMASRLLEKLLPGDAIGSAIGFTEITVGRGSWSGTESGNTANDRSSPAQLAQSSPIHSMPDVDLLSEAEVDDLLSRLTTQETHP